MPPLPVQTTAVHPVPRIAWHAPLQLPAPKEAPRHQPSPAPAPTPPRRMARGGGDAYAESYF